MRGLGITAPEYIDKAWTAPTPHDKPTSTSKGRRLAGNTKRVIALAAKLKVKPKLRWW